MSLDKTKLYRVALGLATAGGAVLLLSGSASAATVSTTTDSGTTQITSESTQTTQTAVTQTTSVSGSGVVVTDVTLPPGSDGSVTPPNPTSTSEGGAPDQTVTPNATSNSPAAAAAAEPGSNGSSQGGSVAAPVTRWEPKLLASWSHLPEILASSPAAEAAAAPVVADRGQQPAPAQPNGLLGDLTLQLAGTVVPDFLHWVLFAPASLSPRTVVWPLAIAILMLLFAQGYAARLRRGGYATAARSDVAGSHFLFATPLILNYAQATSPPIVHILWWQKAKT